MTEEEYQYIQPIVNKSYLINNEKDGSHFVEVKPENLLKKNITIADMQINIKTSGENQAIVTQLTKKTYWGTKKM